jgi:CRP-like cAMP-binding protein
MDWTERRRVLAAGPLCAGLTAAALEELCVAATTHSIAANDYLFSEDEPARACYVVASGQLRLSKLAATGEQVILRIVQPPDPVGIIAVLPQAVYPLSALALRPCTLLAWDQATLIGLVERHPLLAVRALHLVSGRFIELQQQYLERNVERVERRLARTLLRLSNQVGRHIAEGVLIDMSLSRRDLAEMSGTTLYTASRTLSRWEQEGIVASTRTQVVICAPHRLVVIADDLPE